MLRYKESTGEITLDLARLLIQEKRLDEARELLMEEAPQIKNYARRFPDTKYSRDLVRWLRELQTVLGGKPSD